MSAKGDCDGHYTDIGSSYDKFYAYTAKSKISIITRLASFSPEDTVLDFGGGTGEIGHRLWKEFNFKQPVMCVDPSESMLEVAKKKEGLKTTQATAEDYISRFWDGTLYSRGIMIGCYHHIKDEALVIEGISKMLTDDGVFMIMRQTKETAKSFSISHARHTFTSVDFHQVAQLAESKGLKAKVVCESAPFEVSKEFCFEFVRNRMWCWLYDCTDQEIEEGIEELKVRYKDCDIIKVDYKMNILVITKH